MCSVVGYIGKDLCASLVIEGLARLEYRGYDSAGFACLDHEGNDVRYVKASGPLSNIITLLQEKPIDGFVGIGHTRWSTHGDFSYHSAHPHLDCTKTISVVHNGIIENYAVLKKQLLDAGHIFSSYTDTEVIPHLFEALMKTESTVKQVVLRLVNLLHGAYACVMLAKDHSDTLFLIRKKSPLCIGIGDGEMFVASDPIAFATKTNRVVFLPDESFAFVSKNNIELYSFIGERLSFDVCVLPDSCVVVDKDGHEHFMRKEIFEQRAAIERTVVACKNLGEDLWRQLGISFEYVQVINRICIIACGTSWHAASMAQFFFEDIAHIAVEVRIASEYRYSYFFPDTHTLYIVLSQSGETADVLEVVRLLNSHKLCVVAITNSLTSTIVRESGGFLLTHAGLEIAVAATKSFSTQIAVLYWLAYRIAQVRNIVSVDHVEHAEQDLLVTACALESVLLHYEREIQFYHAPRYAVCDNALFVGRHISYPLALEAALKVKEIGYVFAQSYPAGELKHGALALVDSTVPVYLFSHHDTIIYQKLLANAHEIKARGGRIIVFAYEGQDELIALAETVFICMHTIPALLGPLAMIGVVQFLMYMIALERGCPIDKPRNLAKSVTVE